MTIKYRRQALFAAGMCFECALYSFFGGHYIFAILPSVVCVALLLPELMNRQVVVTSTIHIDPTAHREAWQKAVSDAIARAADPIIAQPRGRQ